MPRVKRGVGHVKKRRALHKRVKGFEGGRKTLIKLAKTADTKAGAYAYSDRRKKKRTMRRLWQVRINAAVRALGTTYSHFIGDCKKKEGQDIQIGFQFELDYEGLSFLRKGDFVKALECFQGMSTNSEEYWKVCFFISRCFMEMGRYDLAISHLVRLLANLDKKGSEVANEARLFMGLNYFHKGSVRDAINSFEEIISYDVNFYGVSKNLEWLKKFSLVFLNLIPPRIFEAGLFEAGLFEANIEPRIFEAGLFEAGLFIA